MILITGANGHLGTATIEFFKSNTPNAKIAGLVRSREKGAEISRMGAELRIGDYFDKQSLNNAMAGVKTLALIPSSTLENRVGQHGNVINAATEAGVERIIYISMLQADKLLSPLAADHKKTEDLIVKSDIPYTFNRHTFYTEFFPIFLGQAMETGTWTFPSNGKRINFAWRTEMAEALANELTDPEKHAGKTYEITSSTAFTLDEYAGMLNKASGKKINYKDVSVDDFVDGLKKADVPEDIVTMSKLSAVTVTNGALDHTSGDLEKLLGRKPASAQDFIKSFVAQP